MSENLQSAIRLSRRSFLAATLASGVALTACGRQGNGPGVGVSSTDPIAVAEAARPHTGKSVAANLTAAQSDIDLGGTVARTLAYNDQVPGPLIRAAVGDELAVNVVNGLPNPSSLHWHGIALRNDMDGAAPATPNISPGGHFTYRFTSPHPGTYWAHPHTGLDADHGLYLPVIIDDPAEPGRYDAEWIVMLDDWTAGVGSSPQQIYDALRAMTASGEVSPMPGMHNMPAPGTGRMPAVPGVGGMGSSELLGGDSGDVSYPYYLINGRIATAPTTFAAKPGQRVRIRIINAASDTAFRVALAGHPMTVTHTDGFPVVPTEVDAVLLGMGERYDVVVTAGDGVFPLAAVAEGKNAVARTLLSTGSGSAPDPTFQPSELHGRVGTVDTFTAAPEVALQPTNIDTALTAQLSGTM
ncbi:MAG: multicopper oxidase family protein, partial [Mycobacterium sp.]